MNQQQIDEQIKNYKIRQGYLYKRSRFKRQWRKRLVIFTLNYIFTYQNNNQTFRLTQKIHLKQVVSYTSQLRKEQNNNINTIIIKTKDKQFAFAMLSDSIIEKWSWIVTIERLFNFSQKGASVNNDLDKIRTKGFMSLQQYMFLDKMNHVPIVQYTTISREYQQTKLLQHINTMHNQLKQQERILMNKQQHLMAKVKQATDIQYLYLKTKNEKLNLTMKLQEIQNRLQLQMTNNSNNILIELQNSIWKWFIFYMKEYDDQILQFVVQMLKMIYKRINIEDRKQAIDNIKCLCQLSQNSQMLSRFSIINEQVMKK